MIITNNDKEKQITTLREGLSTLLEGTILDMNSFRILELFFEQGNDKYIQTFVDDFFINIDMSNFVKEYHNKINILLGANLSKGNISFKDVKELFFESKVYTIDNLNKVGFFNKINKIPSINLTNNNFKGDDWDFTKFLEQIYLILVKYIEDKYDSNVNLNPLDDEYNINLEKCITIDLANILDKLIPDLKNTGLKISYKPKFGDSKFKFNLFQFILQSGKFDGCYLDVNVTSYNQSIVITSEEPFYYDEYFNLKVVGGTKKLIKEKK